MDICYAKDKTKNQCESVKEAKKLFGGDMGLATSLLSRINALKQAETIKDIIVQPAFRFHNLENNYGRNLKGFFAIDVKSKREPWRIILQPLNEAEEYYDPCNIDEISGMVRIVDIAEVSKHYE